MLRQIGAFYLWSIGAGLGALVVVTLARGAYDAWRDRRRVRAAARLARVASGMPAAARDAAAAETVEGAFDR